MRKYWIDKVIITPEGKRIPKLKILIGRKIMILKMGFEWYIENNVAKIIVPSDLYKDINPWCYKEEIILEQEITH